MGKFINLKGKRFGRLVVLERDFYCRQGHVKWKCQCDCGNIHSATTQSLRVGKVTSCGCYNKDSHTTHGMSGTRLYKIWNGMKCRCYQKSHMHYDKYGGRGIKVCDEWLDFNVFLNWAIMNGYNDNLTIERIDNDGDYEPNNCKWITNIEQQKNKSNTRYLTHNGESKPLTKWAEELGVNKSTLRSRLDRGWSDSQVLFGKDALTI